MLIGATGIKPLAFAGIGMEKGLQPEEREWESNLFTALHVIQEPGLIPVQELDVQGMPLLWFREQKSVLWK